MKRWFKIITLVICGLIVMVIIDLVCVFTINRPLFAISDDGGFIYKGLFYDVYNCPEYSVSQIKLKGTKFNCGVLNIIEAKESKYKISELENVSIDIYDISLTGATIVIKDTNENPYTYGDWYRLEKQVGGKWYEVNTIIDNFGFNAIGYLPNKDNEVKFVIDWEWLYGELPLGSYRILKEAGNKYISIEFDIATTS